MKLTAKLALSQIKANRGRSAMTLLGIVLSSAMLTAVCGYIESAKQTIYVALDYAPNAGYHPVLLAMGAVLGAIIISASVIVVSNAFRVSAGERTRQFGILKSVGATKRQIAESVLYEGVWLSIIGIPIGIAVGLLLELLGTSVITGLLNSMSADGVLHLDSEELLNIPFATPPLMFVIAAVTSFGTVLLSAWLPARKAARIAAIDAIRGASEVKLKKRSVRTSKLPQAVFGFEGTLAAKSLKRSRRSFRATVVSLTISIVMLIAAGSFSELTRSVTNLVFPNIDASAVADWGVDSEDQENQSDVYVSLDSVTADVIAEKLRGYNNAEIYGVGAIRNYSATLPDGTKTKGALVSVDAKHYEELCARAYAPLGSALLVNFSGEDANGKKSEHTPYNFSEFKDNPLTFSLAGHESVTVPIAGQLTGQDVPNEIVFILGPGLTVIVPDGESTSYSWYAKAQDSAGFTKHAKQVLDEFAPQSTDDIYVYAQCTDITVVTKQMDNIVNTIMFFVYGFVGMLTLIAVTSVISTISTNIRSRAREFAVLQSVGMTKPGIKKMLNLESILCSARALIFGIPIGLIGAYALYRTMGLSIEVPFRFPWLPVAQCVIGVFAVTWITMRYSASRLKNGSIIETIRED